MHIKNVGVRCSSEEDDGSIVDIVVTFILGNMYNDGQMFLDLNLT